MLYTSWWNLTLSLDTMVKIRAYLLANLSLSLKLELLLFTQDVTVYIYKPRTQHLENACTLSRVAIFSVACKPTDIVFVARFAFTTACTCRDMAQVHLNLLWQKFRKTSYSSSSASPTASIILIIIVLCGVCQLFPQKMGQSINYTISKTT